MSAWQQLIASGALTSIDAQFGKLLHRRSPRGVADAIAVAGALLSSERGRGHSCVELARHAGAPFPSDGAGSSLPPLPDLDTWCEQLAKSKLVGSGKSPTPLVDDGDGRLYLYRYWQAERRLAERIRRRLERDHCEIDASVLTPLYDELFHRHEEGEIDWQGVAAYAALRGAFTVVTGGPGTGKTTTVVRILSLMLAKDPRLSIALAAPTGKAAARLSESITAQVDAMPDEIRELVPREVTTIHRLLGFRPRSGEFAYGAGNPLTAQLVVVDEASMIDLLLMDALFGALSEDAGIILLGDHDQLASVETGTVLGDLCRAAEAGAGYGAGFTSRYRELSGDDLDSRDGATPLGESIVRLRVNHRFQAQPGIASLCEAIRVRDAKEALRIVGDDALPDAVLSEQPPTPLHALAPILPQLEECRAAETPEAALAAFDGVRIICALREGPWGVRGFNEVVEEWWGVDGSARSRFYRGRPVLVTSNDYQTRLFNGDFGVSWPDENGHPFVYFPASGGGLRRFSPARLPEHETAWAMTVHKCQGSEFDHVLLVLPESDHPLCTRELVYTGVTRARSRVHLVGADEWLESAIERDSRRSSGLAELL